MRGTRELAVATATACLALTGHCQSEGANLLGDAWRLATSVSADTVVHDSGPNAFGFALPALGPKDRRAFVVGNSFFKQNWVTSPSSTADRDGLGPLFNARSCSSCHLRDGRSAPPGPTDIDRHGLLLRIGIRSSAATADALHPVYGGQIQDVGIHGVAPEARIVVTERTIEGRYGDGTTFTLLAPSYALADLGYGPLDAGAVLGPRVAPHLIGLGLLEAIPTASLRTVADPDDHNGDGISGRLHELGTPASVGRFGWKATQPSVHMQVAAAFVNDMGITSPLFPAEVVTARQADTLRYAPSADAEIDAATLARVVFYTQSLAVPAERDGDAQRITAGRAHFAAFGCAACHVPAWKTGPATHPAFEHRTIAPFTDLLLHDLGPLLADEKRDGDAAPSEWRTAPLWGLGLISTVNGHERLLHDGRARSVAEAILWHGGEAERAKERFRLALPEARLALVAFVQSL